MVNEEFSIIEIEEEENEIMTVTCVVYDVSLATLLRHQLQIH